jgi:hypothetical protein
MREDSAHARNHDLNAAAEIFANGSYFPNTLRTFFFILCADMRYQSCIALLIALTSHIREILN